MAKASCAVRYRRVPSSPDERKCCNVSCIATCEGTDVGCTWVGRYVHDNEIVAEAEKVFVVCQDDEFCMK